MNEEKILTQHPAGKNGVNISKAKYDFIRSKILEVLEMGDLPALELSRTLADRYQAEFDGSVMWYATSVKQDLEARGILKARPKTKPPKWYVDHEVLNTNS